MFVNSYSPNPPMHATCYPCLTHLSISSAPKCWVNLSDYVLLYGKAPDDCIIIKETLVTFVTYILYIIMNFIIIYQFNSLLHFLMQNVCQTHDKENNNKKQKQKQHETGFSFRCTIFLLPHKYFSYRGKNSTWKIAHEYIFFCILPLLFENKTFETFCCLSVEL
jgi:hypothetical protein